MKHFLALRVLMLTTAVGAADPVMFNARTAQSGKWSDARNHLLIRDCVGYQSRGHGFFLEDATEQWNVLDRNLAVQAFGSVPLPKQVLSYDPQ